MEQRSRPAGRWRSNPAGGAGKVAGCPNKVKFTIKDSTGKKFTIGRFKSSFSLFENAAPYWVYRRSVDVPDGIAPGPAKLIAYQSWEVGIAGITCFRIFEHDAKRPISIAGAVGNDPPVITGFAAAPVPQGVPTAITWTASESCSMDISVFAEVRRGELAEIGAIATDVPGAQGANQFLWDGSVAGSYMPPGTHRLSGQCTDSSGSRSAPDFTNVTVVYP